MPLVMNRVGGRTIPGAVHGAQFDGERSVGVPGDAGRGDQLVKDCGSLGSGSVLAINVFVTPKVVLALLNSRVTVGNAIAGEISGAVSLGCVRIGTAGESDAAELLNPRAVGDIH